MMSPLTLAIISSTTPMSAAERDAARARDAQTIRNFIYDYCSNYTGRRRRAHSVVQVLAPLEDGGFPVLIRVRVTYGCGYDFASGRDLTLLRNGRVWWARR